MRCNDNQTVKHGKKTELVLLEIDDTGYDGYKTISFVFGHTYQPRLQLSRCFMHMHIYKCILHRTYFKLLLHNDATHT